MSIEQQRRDFMREQPDLYRYIALRESAKALKGAGDNASGAVDGHGAANRVWTMAAQARARYEAMQDPAAQ